MLMQPAHTDAHPDQPAQTATRAYAWVVFALTVGLLLSDYMSRQVLNAVFPLLKASWHLSDTQLGSLSSIVASMVALLTLPLSVLADRWGRVTSIVLMAAVWSLATLGCALSENYGQMLVARALVGVGEAAYGSVGIALVLSIFPVRLRATLSAAFMAGGAFGSVTGMAFGGVVAAHLGWRAAFAVVACFGVVLVAVYRLIVTEKRVLDLGDTAGRAQRTAGARVSLRSLAASLFSTRSVICAYVGSGFHLMVPAAFWAWMPSFINRYYGMAPGRAAVVAAGFVLVTGAGMVVCGMLTDRLNQRSPVGKWSTAIVFCLLTFVLLEGAFLVAHGPVQLMLIAAGLFFSAGATGPSGAMVANLTPDKIHSSAFATLTLANNVLGMAPAAVLTGVIADRAGLSHALQAIPLVLLLAVLAFSLGRRGYPRDLARLDASRESGQTHRH